MRSEGLRRGDSSDASGVDGGECTTEMRLETSKFVHKRWAELLAEVTELLVKKRAEIEVNRGDRSDDGPRVLV
jgi:hypothetical protein